MKKARAQFMSATRVVRGTGVAVAVPYHPTACCHLGVIMEMERGCIAAPLYLRGLDVAVSGEAHE
jgi:hypothetical protein